MASHGVPRPATREARTELARQKEQVKIKEYRELVQAIRDKMAAKEYTRATLALTSKLLSQNPDSYTHWNNRRVILLSLISSEAETDTDLPPDSKNSSTDLLQVDLTFLLPLLASHPKSYPLWTHRLWTLSQLLPTAGPSASLLAHRAELALCTKVLTRDRRNFHGWHYRRQIISRIEELSGEVCVEDEFAYTTRMIEGDLSNFSAWHYRATLIPRLLDLRGAGHEERVLMLEEELELITRAVFTDPGDSSVWFYHNFLLMTTCSAESTRATTASTTTLPDADATPSADVPHNTPFVTLSKEEKQRFLEQEISSIRFLLEEDEDSKWILEALVVYTGMLDRLLSEDDDGKGASGAGGEEERRGWLRRLEELDPWRGGRWRGWAQGVEVCW